MQPTEFNLFFMHPQYGTTFNVTVDAAFTATEMIRNLRLSGFLPEYGQYKLARYETELQPRQTFAEIAELQSGDVIRIIAPQVAETQIENVRINLKLPFIAEFIQISVPLSHSTAELLQLLYEKGILYRFDTEYLIKKGNIMLKVEQTLAEVGLKDFDLLRIYTQEIENNSEKIIENAATQNIDAPDNNTSTILKTLSQQIETLQAKIEQLEAAVLASNSVQPHNQNTNNTSNLATPTLEMPFEPLEILVQKITQQP